MKVSIVNTEDKVIGVKDRKQVQNYDIYRVSALWLRSKQGNILLARRALTKKNDPGKWAAAVAGTVEAGETYEQNIKKEMQEELGIKVKPVAHVKTAFLSGKHKFFCQWYTATVDENKITFKLQKKEVAEVKWFSKKELEDYFTNHPEAFSENAKEWLPIMLQQT